MPDANFSLAEEIAHLREIADLAERLLPYSEDAMWHAMARIFGNNRTTEYREMLIVTEVLGCCIADPELADKRVEGWKDMLVEYAEEARDATP